MTPITTTAELSAFCKSLKGQPFIAVDTEFMRETTYWPKLCLIQVASPEQEACIDPMADGIDLTPLLDILRDEKVQKVFHAARQDVEIFNNLGAMPKPLFDTQIAGMAAGFGEQIAYDALVRQMLKADIDKSSRFTDWSRRPLSETQLVYALGGAFAPGGDGLEDGEVLGGVLAGFEPLPGAFRIDVVEGRVGERGHLLLDPGQAPLLLQPRAQHRVKPGEVGDVAQRIGQLRL